MNKSSTAGNKLPRDAPRNDAASSPSNSESRLAAFMAWLRRIFIKTKDADERPPQRPNPFAVLKAGKKMVVIAAVDAGMISFFRLGPGEFSEWPMV
jgi:tRNA-splicing endonuclease subunit Sen54